MTWGIPQIYIFAKDVYGFLYIRYPGIYIYIYIYIDDNIYVVYIYIYIYIYI